MIIRATVGVTFLVIGIIVALTMFFNIGEITVTGDAVYSTEQIIETSSVNIGDNLIFVSKNKINEKITTELPYVDSVKVKRHLPTGLELIITKTEATYAIASNGYYTLLNKNGKVLECDLEYVDESIILLNLGEIASADVGYTVSAGSVALEKLEGIRVACEENGITDITSIDLSDVYDIKLVYQGRITLELGETDKETLAKKLALGKAAIDTQNEENEFYRGTINLTVDGKGYWSEETSTTEPVTETEEVSEEQTSANSSENTTSTTQTA